MDTSIIIPCYNAERTLALQLDCLTRQDGAAPFEVLIVDNGSTDKTVEVAENWKSHLLLRVVDASQHQGVSYARNRGIAAANGQKLIFLDADDAVPPEYVGFCQRSLDEVPLYVSGFDPVDDEEFSRGREHVLGLISHRTLPYRSPLPDENDSSWPILPGCSFGIDKAVMYRLGGFDLSMEPGAEDNDLAFRVLEHGLSLRVQRSTTIAYRVNNKQRPVRVYYRRAKSVALLKARYSQHLSESMRCERPMVSFLKTCLAGMKIVLTKRSIQEWLPRFGTDAGLAIGHVQYSLLKIVPARRIGEGVTDK